MQIPPFSPLPTDDTPFCERPTETTSFMEMGRFLAVRVFLQIVDFKAGPRAVGLINRVRFLSTRVQESGNIRTTLVCFGGLL